MKSFIFLFITCSVHSAIMAQVSPPSVVVDSTLTDDPIISETDSEVNVEEIETYADKFVPRKATLYAAILPGLGQIYNKKYWKLPIVYGGLIALGATAAFYDREHDFFREELFSLLQDDTFVPPSGANEEQLRSRVDDARRERDFYLIMTGVFYLLQILDAHIDAHLKEFDLNPELKVSVDPLLEPNRFARKTINTGLTFKLTF